MAVVNDGFVGGIYYSGVFDVCEIHLGGHVLDLDGVSDEYDVCEFVGQYSVGGCESAGLGALGQYYAPGVECGSAGKLIK